MRRSTSALLGFFRRPAWRRSYVSCFVTTFLVCTWYGELNGAEPAAASAAAAPGGDTVPAPATEDGPPLPPGFQPPPKKNPAIAIEKPLITEAEESDAKIRRSYSEAMRQTGPLNDKDKKAIAAGARINVYKMTMQKYRQSLPSVRGKILRELSSIQRSKGNSPARQFLLNEVKDRAAELLDNNLYVRISAVYLLGQLNKIEGNRIKGEPGVAYAPAAEPLLKALADPEQHVAVKILAARGLTRIATDGASEDLSRLRPRIAKAAVDQLDQKDVDEWYQHRLVELLGATRLARDRTTGDPFIVQKLAVILADRQRDLVVRSAAVKALGRLPLNGISFEPLAYSIVLLAGDIAVNYNKKPAVFPTEFCLWQLYWGFKPTDAERAKELRAGLLQASNQRPAVTDAYQQVIGLLNHVHEQPATKMQPIPDGTLQNMKKWLQEHKPSELKIAPNQPTYVTAAPAGN